MLSSKSTQALKENNLKTEKMRIYGTSTENPFGDNRKQQSVIRFNQVDSRFLDTIVAWHKAHPVQCMKKGSIICLFPSNRSISWMVGSIKMLLKLLKRNWGSINVNCEYEGDCSQYVIWMTRSTHPSTDLSRQLHSEELRTNSVNKIKPD